jgi:hypothetical protein
MLILLQDKGRLKFHINKKSLGYSYSNVHLWVGDDEDNRTLWPS